MSEKRTSVFAPMIAVMIADFFILRSSHNGEVVCVKNLIIWFAGFLSWHGQVGMLHLRRWQHCSGGRVFIC